MIAYEESSQTRSAIELGSYLRKYEYTIGLRRRDWAWEFLRRNADFAEEAYARLGNVQRSMSCIPNSKVLHLYEPEHEAEKWGVIIFPNPDQAAPIADVYWRPELDPAIVSIIITPRRNGEIDEMKAVLEGCQIDILRVQDGTEHMLTRGKFSSAQSICSGMSLLHAREPVKVNLDMRGPGKMQTAFEAYKLAEEILHPGPWRWTERTKRFRNALICLDVKNAGLSMRAAAEIIYGEERVAEDWPKNKSFRDLVRGYYRTGQTLSSHGYKELLKGGPLDAMA